MDYNQRELLKKYIKKVLLESEVLDIKLTGEASLTYELRKPINKSYPVGNQELNKIKEAIKYRYPDLNTIDFKNNEITFDKQGSPTNFHIVIRKVSNPQNLNQFKYVMWYVPFTEREDIDKPGQVHKKESNPFDKTITASNLLSDIYEFFINALLMN
jgi:hypothetical protein